MIELYEGFDVFILFGGWGKAPDVENEKGGEAPLPLPLVD